MMNAAERGKILLIGGAGEYGMMQMLVHGC